MGSHARWISALMLSASIVWGATISVDPATTYQTMEGFGGYAQGVSSSGQAQFLVEDLGCTVFRYDIPYDFEPQNDNGDAMSIDLSGYATNSSRMSNYKKSINHLKGYPGVKFIASCWSPPAWMKDLSRDPSPTCSNGAGHCGGHLSPAHYQEFAEFMVAYYKTMQRDCGVEMYALSIQNEPFFIEPYKSCVYTPEEYRDVLKVVKARFEHEGIDVILFGSEDMAKAVTAPGRGYFGLINVDPAAKEALGAAAVHGYSNGVDPTPSTELATVWSMIGRIGTGLGRPTWMTETSGFPTTWSGALQLGVTLHAAVSYGNISLWTWWTLLGSTNAQCLLNNYSHSKRSYVSKHFYTYASPGSIRIDARSDNDDIAVTAYHHDADNTLSLILINWSSSPVSVGVSGDHLPSFEAFRTSSSENWKELGTVGSTVTLPGESVSTLYGENYTPAVGAKVAPVSRAQPRHRQGELRHTWYSLHGRRLGADGGIGVRVGVSVYDTRHVDAIRCEVTGLTR